MRTENQRRRSIVNVAGLVALVVVLGGCQPSDRTPGLWLSGDVATTPADWSFSDQHREIYVQVDTPYFLPHSVTIWCAQLDGTLYIGARNPESKNWVGWMDSRRDIRLKIGEQLFDVRAADFDDEQTLTALRAAYAEKYDLPNTPSSSAPPIRYWRIDTRG